MKLILHTFNLELAHTFSISRASISHQPTVIVELRDGKYSGLGEATANSYYGYTADGIKGILDGIRTVVETYEFTTPEKFWKDMWIYLRRFPFAQCALDIAAHDLYAKKQGKKLYEVWGLKPKKMPLTNFTIGLDTIPNMVAKLKEQPWPVYKIKLGTKKDIKIIEALRKHTDSPFRVDANCAWTADETVEKSIILKQLGVEFIEQPLPANAAIRPLKRVFKYSKLPIIADESCCSENDVEKCHKRFHGINVKLVKCGGITPARRMLEKAETLGLKKMMGCMTESSVGIAAIAHFLPKLDYVDMDGALLLKNDVASGVKIKKGKVKFADRNGTGAKLKKT